MNIAYRRTPHAAHYAQGGGHDELEDLGFGLSYQSLTRNIRGRGLRPDCEACRTAVDRPNAVIAHPPGEETCRRT